MFDSDSFVVYGVKCWNRTRRHLWMLWIIINLTLLFFRHKTLYSLVITYLVCGGSFLNFKYTYICVISSKKYIIVIIILNSRHWGFLFFWRWKFFPTENSIEQNFHPPVKILFDGIFDGHNPSKNPSELIRIHRNQNLWQAFPDGQNPSKIVFSFENKGNLRRKLCRY